MRSGGKKGKQYLLKLLLELLLELSLELLLELSHLYRGFAPVQSHNWTKGRHRNEKKLGHHFLD